MTSHSQSSAMLNHVLPCHSHTHHWPIFVSCVFDVSRRIFSDSRRLRVVVFRDFRKMFSDEPMETWPTFEFGNITGSWFRETFEASLGSQSDLNAAGGKKESDLLGWRIACAQRKLNRDRHKSSKHASIPSGDEVQRISVGVNQSDSVAWFQLNLLGSFAKNLRCQSVCNLLSSGKKLSVRQSRRHFPIRV